ncbi:MAG: hypothetical protein HYZ91_05925 [Candidatus Omnitrophica bacterium]|nr:hypothetical protein [Candidatus Omnitrophota bacterium]
MSIIAHRGASRVAPESSAAAIREAVRASADMVELDVQMTRDGRLVIFHDDTLDRTTNGRGLVTQTRYAALAWLDAGSWFHRRFAGERVLLLSQAIRLIPSWMRINLELKRTSRPASLLHRLVRLIRWTRSERRLLVSSFDPNLLQPLRRTPLALALICKEQPEASLRRAIRLGCEAWHPFRGVVSRRRIEQAHAAGLRVRVWTVDGIAQARRFARWGADGVFTNDPRPLVGAFRGNAGQS